MQTGSIEAIGVQLFRHHAGGVFGIAEYNGAADLKLLHQAQDNFNLFAADAADAVLVDLRLAVLYRQDGDFLRVALVQPADVHDLAGDGRREHAHLFHAFQAVQNLAHILIKAHVEHLVRLVKDGGFDALQVDCPMVHQVEQTSWRCHQNVGALFQQLFLALHRLAAVDDQRLYFRQKLGQVVQIVADLGGKLAGRSENNCLNLRKCRVDLFDQRNAKGTGFSGAGRGFGDDVLAFEHRRNRLLLDFGHLMKSQRFGRLQNLGIDRQRRKG